MRETRRVWGRTGAPMNFSKLTWSVASSGTNSNDDRTGPRTAADPATEVLRRPFPPVSHAVTDTAVLPLRWWWLDAAGAAARSPGGGGWCARGEETAGAACPPDARCRAAAAFQSDAGAAAAAVGCGSPLPAPAVAGAAAGASALLRTDSEKRTWWDRSLLLARGASASAPIMSPAAAAGAPAAVLSSATPSCSWVSPPPGGTSDRTTSSGAAAVAAAPAAAGGAPSVFFSMGGSPRPRAVSTSPPSRAREWLLWRCPGRWWWPPPLCLESLRRWCGLSPLSFPPRDPASAAASPPALLLLSLPTRDRRHASWTRRADLCFSASGAPSPPCCGSAPLPVAAEQARPPWRLALPRWCSSSCSSSFPSPLISSTVSSWRLRLWWWRWWRWSSRAEE